MTLKVIATGSSGNCYILTSDSGQMLLLDFGCGTKELKRGLNFMISSVETALLSHSHQDHMKQAKYLLENHIPIYTNKETVEQIQLKVNDLVKSIPEKKWSKIGEFYVMPFYVPHDNCPNYGYLIQHKEMGKLLYLTDLEYFPYTLKSTGINHVLIEVNYIPELVNKEKVNYEHKLRGHSSLESALKTLKTIKTPNLNNVLLVHLSKEDCNPDIALKKTKEEVGDMVNVLVASPGLEIEISELPF